MCVCVFVYSLTLGTENKESYVLLYFFFDESILHWTFSSVVGHINNEEKNKW